MKRVMKFFLTSFVLREDHRVSSTQTWIFIFSCVFAILFAQQLDLILNTS